MGSLATHLSTFLFLFPIGLRRLLCSSSLYLQNPSHFRSKPWFLSHHKWKNVDLYALLVALPIASFSDIFLFLSIPGDPTYRFSFIKQSAVILLFWALLILIILRESVDTPLINESFLFLLAGISFVVDYWMSESGFTGVSSIVYELLGGLTLVCACSCLYLSIWPAAFLAEFFLGSGITFKGTWMLQAGLSLYTDVFVLKGCGKMSVLPGQDKADVKCDLKEDSLRGIALMNLLFIGHAIGVLVIVFGSFCLLSSNQNLRYGEASGRLLAELESDPVLRPPLPELEMD
ncbi:hypothetical protein Nepgr_020723 [Nepenthes gracilis]|uniref:Uncharacterized protein n=1 Tax=Nepenthes gracilis TaxID=150966 RepID=A0AAD3XVB2_NEPGR|nr:hypothetical protein Nepgr_020723 [Nepenthes gracilis]